MGDASNRIKVALTGGIASGKSLVATKLGERGAFIIDADVLARQVVEPGLPSWVAIVERFGTGILRPDGSLNRVQLADIVFSDPQARADLNAIVHPVVRLAGQKIEDEAPADAVIVHVIPLLVETRQEKAFDLVIVVDTDEATQISRLAQRNGLDEQQARARIASQASRAERLKVADFVLDNTGTPDQVNDQVDQVWSLIEQLR